MKDTNPKDAIADSKVPLWLLSAVAKAKWAVAHFAGLLKYGAWNYRATGVRASVYTSAARRHLDAWESGEEVDPVDGTDHRANVMACMAILIDAEAVGKLVDDRPYFAPFREVYAECEALMKRLRGQYKDRDPRHYTIADSREMGVRRNCIPAPPETQPRPLSPQPFPPFMVPQDGCDQAHVPPFEVTCTLDPNKMHGAADGCGGSDF